ncbi:hypothetical protein MPRG_51360 [Mycobacterium paragordonae]|uniref:Uncharacterized protein n=1 Tax=Mycobacterium paragordonae TaxID=1389713 RepID=A0ABQ1CC64_9MYCO|nr:hypothetical protein MPRG_51360 [Mycobacterium paragordonae]
MGRANLGQRVRPLDRHRVRVVTFCQQAGALVPTDPELLGKVPWGISVGVSIGGTHDVPA